MQPQGEVRPPGLNAAGGRQLAAVSSFGGGEAVQLPFDLQRSPLFLLLVALLAMGMVAAAISLGAAAALGLTIAIGVALAVALNPKIGLVLLAAVAPAASGLARGLPAPGFRLSELLCGGIGAILLISARKSVRWTAVDWAALTYALATLCLGGYDVMKRGDSLSSGDLGLLFGPFQFFLLYRAVAVTARTAELRRLALRLVLWASVPVALMALGQQYNLFGLRGLMTTLTGNDIYAAGADARATGPFPHWHNLGGYLFMILLIIAALMIRRVPGVLSRPVLIGIAALDAAALIETLSIAPIAGVVAGSIILAVWLGGVTRIMLILSLAALVSVLLFGSRLETRYTAQFSRAPGSDRSAFVPQTVQYRYDLWTTQLLPKLKGSYITGYGPTLPPQIQNFPYTESLYLGLLFRGGVILLVAWFALAVAMALAGRRSSLDRDPLQQALGATLTTAIICLFFMQLIEGYFVDSGTPHVLWLLLGLLAFREASPAPAVISRRSAEADAIQRRAWGSVVASAVDSLDAGSRTLLQRTYVDGLTDNELVGVLGFDIDTIRRWRAATLSRLSGLTRLPAAEVENVLRSVPISR
jgi:hypothetical protein